MLVVVIFVYIALIWLAAVLCLFVRLLVFLVGGGGGGGGGRRFVLFFLFLSQSLSKSFT